MRGLTKSQATGGGFRLNGEAGEFIGRSCALFAMQRRGIVVEEIAAGAKIIMAQPQAGGVGKASLWKQGSPAVSSRRRGAEKILARSGSGRSLPNSVLGPHRLARLGHHPFTVRTGVRIPVGTPISRVTQVIQGAGDAQEIEHPQIS